MQEVLKMSDYISREDYCEENCGKENREGYKTCTNCGMLNVPSADVQPVRSGRWIIFCSECKHEAYWDTDYGQQLFDYCPYCGARMNEDNNEKREIE
jgi:hypothetical protein